MDIQKHLDNAVRLFKEQPVLIVLGGLIVTLLNIVSFGLLSGPLAGGYILMMIVFLRDNKQINFNDLFSGFTRFGELFPFCVVSFLVFLGFVFFVIPGLLLITWWIYVLMLMADQRMPLGEAMRVSKAKVDSNGFFMHMVFVFMITIVPSFLLHITSTAIPFLGVLQVLLLPFQCGCLASLYIEQFERVPTKSEEAAIGQSEESDKRESPDSDNPSTSGLN